MGMRIVNRLRKTKDGKTHTFVLPKFEEQAFTQGGCSIIYFGAVEVKGKKYRPFFGIGAVIKIEHGEHIDCVYVKFGNITYRVIASMNHARRYVMSLVRGHICSVFGGSRVHLAKYKTKDGKEFKKYVHRLYAWAFQDWYLPRTADFKANEQYRDELTKEDEEWLQERELKEMSLEDMDMKGDL